MKNKYGNLGKVRLSMASYVSNLRYFGTFGFLVFEAEDIAVLHFFRQGNIGYEIVFPVRRVVS